MSGQRLRGVRRLGTGAALGLVVVATTAVMGLGMIRGADARSTDQLVLFQQSGASALAVEGAFKRQVQEWKNILLRGSVEADYAKHHAGFVAERKEMAEELGRLASLVERARPARQPAMERLTSEMAVLQQEYDQQLVGRATVPAADARTMDAALRGKDRSLSEQVRAIAAELRDEAVAEYERASRSRDERMRLLTEVLMVESLAGIAWIVWSTTRSIRGSGDAP